MCRASAVRFWGDNENNQNVSIIGKNVWSASNWSETEISHGGVHDCVPSSTSKRGCFYANTPVKTWPDNLVSQGRDERQVRGEHKQEVRGAPA